MGYKGTVEFNFAADEIKIYDTYERSGDRNQGKYPPSGHGAEITPYAEISWI